MPTVLASFTLQIAHDSESVFRALFRSTGQRHDSLVLGHVRGNEPSPKRSAYQRIQDSNAIAATLRRPTVQPADCEHDGMAVRGFFSRDAIQGSVCETRSLRGRWRRLIRGVAAEGLVQVPRRLRPGRLCSFDCGCTVLRRWWCLTRRKRVWHARSAKAL